MNTSRTFRATAYAAALTAIALSPFTARAQSAPASADDINALREQIRLLDQKLRVLERNQELKDETAAAEAKKLPKITASDGRIEIASADGANSLRLRGLVQADARLYFGDANAAQDGFVLRRARLIFEGKFSDRFTYVVQPEFAGSSVSILDANVGTAINPAFNIQAGRFKTPVGLEQLQSDATAFFNERSIATNLAPNRDVGLQVFGSFFDNRLGYQAAVTNGVIDGGNSPADSLNNEGDFTASGRLFATPFVNDKDSALKGLGFGVGAARGNYQGSITGTGTGATATSLLSTYRTDGQQNFFRYRTASSGTSVTAANTTLADGESFVISPQAYYYYGPLGVLAEYFYTGSEVKIGSGATLNHQNLHNTAYNLSVGYVLTGEDASYKGVVPKTTFNPSAGTWGAFEVVARFAYLDIDNDAFVDPDGAGAGVSVANVNQSATAATSYGVGLNWYLSKSVRTNFDFFKTEFKLPPGSAPAADSVLRDDELAFIGRVQISF